MNYQFLVKFDLKIFKHFLIILKKYESNKFPYISFKNNIKYIFQIHTILLLSFNQYKFINEKGFTKFT